MTNTVIPALVSPQAIQIYYFQRRRAPDITNTVLPALVSTQALFRTQTQQPETMSDLISFVSFGHLFSPDLYQAIFELRYIVPEPCQI